MDAGSGAHPRSPRLPRVRRYLGIAVCAFVSLVVVAAAVDAALLWRRPNRVDVRLPGSAPGGSTVLLVGTDSRADDVGPADDRRFGTEEANPGERADVMLAVRRDADGRVRMLELPRDLLVVGARGAPVRLTTTLLSGPSGLTSSLCRSLGLGVDHIVEIRFPGLRSIIDTVGGVDVVTERPIRDTYTKFRLGAGRHRLNGDDTLAYVAARQVEVQQPDGQWVVDPTALGNRSSKGAEVLRDIGRSALKF
ncbi:MAG: LCP family protein, partial [Actinomycetes bacterium]